MAVRLDSIIAPLENNILGSGNHINRWHNKVLLVVPVSTDVRVWLEVIDPSIPHHLMGEVSVLRYSHRVYNTTDSIVLAASMGLCVTEDNLCATGVDLCS